MSDFYLQVILHIKPHIVQESIVEYLVWPHHLFSLFPHVWPELNVRPQQKVQNKKNILKSLSHLIHTHYFDHLHRHKKVIDLTEMHLDLLCIFSPLKASSFPCPEWCTVNCLLPSSGIIWHDGHVPIMAAWSSHKKLKRGEARVSLINWQIIEFKSNTAQVGLGNSQHKYYNISAVISQYLYECKL